MKTILRRSLVALLATFAGALPAGPGDVIIALGAAGEAEYGESFHRQAEAWSEAGDAAGMTVQRVDSKPALRDALAALPPDGDDLWLVLIGHGSFDGRTARFNVTGEDLSGAELALEISRLRRRVVVLALFAASGAWVGELSGPNRVIVTATRSGGERNYARFGEKLAAVLADAAADLDGDGRVSLLELGLLADRRTAEFYEGEQRLVPEHAALDDNGDKVATEFRRLERGRGTRDDGATAAALTLRGGPVEPTTLSPRQQAQREAVERRIDELRERRKDMTEEEFLRAFEPLAREMADIYAGTAEP